MHYKPDQFPPHPRQPVVITNNVARYKKNAIVAHLLERSPLDMNAIAVLDFPREDHEQFAQLIGYSVSGASGLPYFSDETCQRAQQEAEALIAQQAPPKGEEHEWVQRVASEIANANAERYEPVGVHLRQHPTSKQVRIEFGAAIEGGVYSKYYHRPAASPWFDSPAQAFAALAEELASGRLKVLDLCRNEPK